MRRLSLPTVSAERFDTLRPTTAEATLLAAAGAAGERVLAGIRLLLASVLLLIPLVGAVFGQPAEEQLVGLMGTSVAFVLAVLAWLLTRRDQPLPWLGFATSVLDVTLVSLALGVFVAQGLPHTAVNSKVVFEMYFLAIGATCLRYDLRISLLAGGLAIAQFLGLSWWAWAHYDLNGPQYAPYDYGVFSWAAQVNRCIVLAAFTVLAGAIVQRARSLRRLSTIDRLTGVANRGTFDEHLDAELARRARTRRPLAVVMLDVDHFKAYNDRHGHGAGDEALRTLAGLMRRQLRRSDLVARYGGEEFVILMPETTAEQAREKVEVLRAMIAALPFVTGRRGETGQLTFSAGIAAAPEDGGSADLLLEAADSRLFAAKRAGRNRVVGGQDVRIAVAPTTREYTLS